MAFRITLEKADLEWLDKLIQGQIERVNRASNPEQTGGWSNYIEHMLAIRDACENKVVVKDENETPVKRRTKEDVEAEKKIALCKTHPTRTLVRRPGDDCKTCWSAYKRLEPMKYDKAWREFKAAQRKKEA